jgi:hypothetical protein
MPVTVVHAVIPGTSDNPAVPYSKGEHEDAALHLITVDVVNADVNAAAGIVESKLALNFPTFSSVNVPTVDEKGALGTIGGQPAPTAANPFTTNEDTRWANLPTLSEKGGLAGYGLTGPSDTNRYVLQDAPILVNSIKIPVSYLFLAATTTVLTCTVTGLSEVEVGPSGLTVRRHLMVLGLGVDARITASIGGTPVAGAELRAQYTTDLTGATGWTALGAVTAVVGAGMRPAGGGGWSALAAAAKVPVEVLTRIVLYGPTSGNVAIGFLGMQVR